MPKRHSYQGALFFLTGLVLVFGFKVPAQAQLGIAPIQPERVGKSITCRVGGESYDLTPDTELIRATRFAPDNVETQEIFDKVNHYANLHITIYTIPVTNKINVQICPADGGMNYIAYSPKWLQGIFDETNNTWVLYAIFAHEVGHYVLAHDRTSLGSNPDLEKKADEYAGEILAKMGAALPDAQAAFNSEIMRRLKGSTHPPVADRLAAVKRGWERFGKTQPSRSVTTASGGEARRSKSEKVTIGSTGYIQGLNGRLNPILDSYNRTYLYADNIAIEGGKNQPVDFTPNQPFEVEDSVGNRFELTVVPNGNESFSIGYTRLSSAAYGQRADLNIRVVNQSSQPVAGADILVIFSDGTYLQTATNSEGNARLQKLKHRIVSIYCAHRNYSAFYKEEHDADSALVIRLESESGRGSVIINSTGYIPGLEGRLNPKLDTYNRMYLYADNISIENGRKQPADFRLNDPFRVEDSQGKKFELTVIAMKASSSLIEFKRLE
jgi:hypothetical protein